MPTQLKYEHIKPGQRIRAFDFEPMLNRRERFVEGVVLNHYTHPRNGVKFLHIEVHVDTLQEKHPRQEVMVPMETDGDSYWDVNRVSVL